MITIKFQALDKYEKQNSDEELVEDLAQNLQNKYPRLFEDNEVTMDVRVNQHPRTLDKEVTVVSFIPKHGKVVSSATESTFKQAISQLKTDLDRASRNLMSQWK